ncbi:MAG TPA: CDP-diacylglycerol--serine O-phosphatidyltransferase [Planctomycetota bacterium]|nr:CDP-diacylglycerol--serine O-phosphatidyltransferase [Planctomycetota bacterium]
MKVKLKRLKVVPILPSLLTIGNLLSGFAALYYLMKFDYSTAAWMIFVAMAFDMLDGKMARFTNSTSQFGVHLDSLADVISFGLVPAFLTMKLVITSTVITYIPIRIIWAIAAFYLVCATLRLARFNTETTTKEEDHQFFFGLPTPGAAAVVASLVILHQHIQNNIIISALPYIVLLTSVLMISRLRYTHFLNRFLKARPLTKLVEIILVVIFILLGYEITLSVIFLFYALSGVVSHFKQKIFARRMATAQLNESR